MSTDAFVHAAFPRFGSTGAEEVRERARRHGYAQGHAEGMRAAAAESAAREAHAEAQRAMDAAEQARRVDEAVAALHRAAAALDAHAHALTAAAQERVLGHAVELAEFLVAGELRGDESAAMVTARRILSVTDAGDARTVRVHPAVIRSLPAGNLPDRIEFVADDTLAPGDAVVELPDGFIDARLDAALDRARDAIGIHAHDAIAGEAS
jgi:flagellar assembly protein FliH